MSKNFGLGKGLNALIPEDALIEDKDEKASKSNLININLI